MNETYWEQAKKAHKKRLLLIVVVGLFVLITSGIIISNNGDLLNGRNETTQESAVVDSALFVFGMTDSAETEKFIDNADSPATSVSTHTAKKGVDLQSSIDTVPGPAIKAITVKNTKDKIKEPAAKNDNNSSIHAQLDGRKPVIEHPKSEMIDKKLNNIDSLQQYSILLPVIQSSVIDRKDIIISLALELFYRDSTDSHELLLKRDALKVVAIKLIQMKELNSIKKENLSEELKNEMNLIFDRKTLLKVTIREFHIEKVAAQ